MWRNSAKWPESMVDPKNSRLTRLSHFPNNAGFGVVPATSLVAQRSCKRIEKIQRFEVRVNGQALVLAVGAIVVALEGNGRVAVAWNPGLREVDRVACAVFHNRRNGNARPDGVGDAREG